MEQLLGQVPQQIVNGLTLGSVYALLALGYSMVYGVLKMLNFAHGSVFMVGAFAGWWALSSLAASAPGVPQFIAIAATVCAGIAATALLGAGIERFAYRPLRRGSRMAPLISALGVSIVLDNAAMLLTSGRAKSYPSEMIMAHSWTATVAGASISASRIAMLAASVLVMLLLDRVVARTDFGRALRATSHDQEAAEYMGVNTTRVIASTFIIGSAIAGLAGVMIGLYYTQVDFMIGFSAGLKAFTAAVLGGIGSFRGAMYGGLILGLAESIGVLLAPPVYKDAIVFSVLILTLILRPAGILGRPSRSRA